VTTDSGKFRQVIVNLVGNAMKFTPQNGSITIRAKLAKTGKKIKIEVVDTGIGVNKNDQRQIFSKFVQIDNTLNRTYQGSGLGLAISKEIVSHMG
jgi:signal transduction histidine kinase